MQVLSMQKPDVNFAGSYVRVQSQNFVSQNSQAAKALAGLTWKETMIWTAAATYARAIAQAGPVLLYRMLYPTRLP